MSVTLRSLLTAVFLFGALNANAQDVPPDPGGCTPHPIDYSLFAFQPRKIEVVTETRTCPGLPPTETVRTQDGGLSLAFWYPGSFGYITPNNFGWTEALLTECGGASSMDGFNFSFSETRVFGTVTSIDRYTISVNGLIVTEILDKQSSSLTGSGQREIKSEYNIRTGIQVFSSFGGNVTTLPGTSGCTMQTVTNFTSGPTASPWLLLPTLPPEEEEPAVGKIAVASANFVQVIEDPLIFPSSGAIDAVLGKSASFKISLSSSNIAGKSGSFSVVVKNSSGGELSRSNSIPVSALTNGAYTIRPEDMTIYVPREEGPLAIAIGFEFSNAPNVEGITFSNMALNVVKTFEPATGIWRLGDCRGLFSCYGSASQANVDRFIAGAPLVSDALAVADNAISYVQVEEEFHGNIQSPNRPPRFNLDVMEMQVQKMLLGLDRMVAVVPDGYFAFQNSDPVWSRAIGLTPLPPAVAGSVMLVSERAYVGTPVHEFYHSLGVNYEFTVANGIYNGPLVSGYNARTRQAFTNVWSIMAPGLRSFLPSWPANQWVDVETYSIGFRTLASPPIDPEVLIVSGVIGQNGAVTFGPSYSISNGKLSESDPTGDIQVRVLNSRNQVLSSISFKLTTAVLVQLEGEGNPLIDLGYMSFAVALPDSPEAEIIQILRNGQELARNAVDGLSLHGIIQSIPLSAFDIRERCRNEEERLRLAAREKQKLLDQADVIMSLMSAGTSKKAKAYEKLKDLIKDVKQKTKRNFAAVGPTDLSQDEVLEQLDNILDSLKTGRHHKKHVRKCKFHSRHNRHDHHNHRGNHHGSNHKRGR